MGEEMVKVFEGLGALLKEQVCIYGCDAVKCVVNIL